MTALSISDTKTAEQILLQTESLDDLPLVNRVASLLRRASAHGFLGHTDRELTTLHRAVAEQKTWRTLTSRAQYYHRRGEFKLELVDRMDVIALEPTDARAHDKLASVYRHLKYWAKALEEYDTFYNMMVEGGKDTQIYDEVYLNRGMCYQGLKQYQKAIHEYDCLLRRVKHHRRTQLHKCECLMEMGEKDRAIDLLKEIQQHATKHIDSETRARAIIMLAKEARAREDHKLAENYFQGAKVAIGNSRLSKLEKDKEYKEIDLLRSCCKYPYVAPLLHKWVFHPPPLVIKNDDQKEGKEAGDTVLWLPSKLFDDTVPTALPNYAPYLQPIQSPTATTVDSIAQSRPLLHRALGAQDIYRWMIKFGPDYKRHATACLNHGYDGATMYELSRKKDEEAREVLKSMGVEHPAHVLKIIVSIRSAFVEGCC